MLEKALAWKQKLAMVPSVATDDTDMHDDNRSDPVPIAEEAVSTLGKRSHDVLNETIDLDM